MASTLAPNLTRPAMSTSPSPVAARPSARARIRAAAEVALTASGIEYLSRYRVRNGTLVLAYHNIVPPGEAVVGDRSLHLSVSEFAAQLDALIKTHDVLPLQDALAAPVRRRRPIAVITFDDAYHGAVTCGVKELARRSLPATIFVAPAYIGGRAFWWDRLLFSAADLPDSVRAHALDDLAGDDERITAWASTTGVRETALPQHARCSSEQELIEAVRQHPGLSIGSHSWSHINLARIERRRLDAELARPLEWLRARFSRVIPILAYPYGLSSQAVEAAVSAAGYDAAVRVDGGWLTGRPTNAFAIPRLNVPAGMTRRGFVLRGAGILC